MKKKMIGVFVASLLIVGCEKESGVGRIVEKEKSQVVANKKEFILEGVARQMFEIVMTEEELHINEVEKIISENKDNSIEKVDVEGSVLYQKGEESIEIRKGIEGGVEFVEYKFAGGSKSIGYKSDRGIPMMFVSREYDEVKGSVDRIAKLSDTEMQKEYLEVISKILDGLKIEDVKGMTGYNYKEGYDNGADSNLLVYSVSEENEGMIIETDSGKVTSVVYNNIPNDDALDVRSYECSILGSSVRNKVKIYRGMGEVDELLDLLK